MARFQGVSISEMQQVGGGLDLGGWGAIAEAVEILIFGGIWL